MFSSPPTITISMAVFIDTARGVHHWKNQLDFQSPFPSTHDIPCLIYPAAKYLLFNKLNEMSGQRNVSLITPRSDFKHFQSTSADLWSLVSSTWRHDIMSVVISIHSRYIIGYTQSRYHWLELFSHTVQTFFHMAAIWFRFRIELFLHTRHCEWK